MSPREPGLFTKSHLTLSVYVDDSMMDGPRHQELVDERSKI